MDSLRKFIFPLVLGVGLILLLFSACGSYNRAVTLDESVKKAWSQVENVYQRRADLIPNLVNTVKGYADFEQETLTKVIEARASATQMKIDPSNLTAENIERFEQAQQSLSGALGRLMVLTENYPNLKANEQFLDLQKQLEGTENRITQERKVFNESVNSYNATIRRFPMALFAGMFGFTPKGYFQASPGSDKAPTVNFK